MRHSSRQNPRTLWPSGSGLPVAVLAFEPDELERHYGLRFREDVDDLDRLVFAILRLDDGSNALLYKHAGDPNPGTVVNVDAHANLSAERELLERALHLEPGNLLWVAPEAEQHQGAFV
jgi:hypothetical protein